MQKYDGKKADLFAAAVILFMFVTRCQPFDSASPNDPCFNLIAAKQTDFFWKVYEQVASLSDDLRDLLIGMMEYRPDQRYTLDQVMAHPWMQGPVPTAEALDTEMSQRLKVEATNSDSTVPSVNTTAGSN